MHEQWTCGKGLAANSTLPAQVGELVAAIADVLETHMKALDLSDPASRQEHEAYRRLVQAHRQAGQELKEISQAMAGYRDLPMGRHDMAAMGSPAVRQSFGKVVELEKELLSLLQQRIRQDQQILLQLGP